MMNMRQIFLLFCGIAIMPVGMSYGIVPAQSLDLLFGFTVANVNEIHIFRAVMGIYLALGVFWLLAAFNGFYRQAGLYSILIFVVGLVAGRLLSVVLDGMPGPVLTSYILVELVGVVVACILINKQESVS